MSSTSLIYKTSNVLETGDFLRARADSNCPVDNILITEGKCRAASVYLGMKFVRHYMQFNRPAGCYWRGGSLYLNTVLDPLAVTIHYSPKTGGVCLRGMSTYILMI